MIYDQQALHRGLAKGSLEQSCIEPRHGEGTVVDDQADCFLISTQRSRPAPPTS